MLQARTLPFHLPDLSFREFTVFPTAVWYHSNKTWSHFGVLLHHSRARGFHPQQHSGFSSLPLPKMSQTPMLGIWGAPQPVWWL